MTKLNWEKASKMNRYFRAVFAPDRPADKPLEFETFPSKRTIFEAENPLGLTEVDCLGRMPEPDKRTRIAVHLLQGEAAIREIYGLAEGVPLNEAAKKASDDFKRFCRLVAISCDADSSPERNFWPLAVCFSVFFLDYYNLVIANNGPKASHLTWGIWEKISNFRPDLETPFLKNNPKIREWTTSSSGEKNT